MDKNHNNSTILIVDDVPINIRMIASLLIGPYTLLVASNGRDAIEIASNKPVDIILLDIQMPEMDGYEVCSFLKSNPATSDIPIIFLTAM
ncbi:MAG: response regulator, partial [Magnetococcales bacterium]|nr:response regulator [Magnetococcales bacterium]